MNESDGEAKGSSKDHFRFLNILMKIIKKKKLKIKLLNVNSERIELINRFYVFFYTPVNTVLKDDLKAENLILFDVAKTQDINLIKEEKSKEIIDLQIISRKRPKKGIDEIKEIEKEKKEEIKKEDTKKNQEKIKEELEKKYNVENSSISDSLVADYLAIQNNSVELFGVELDQDVKEALVLDRIKAEQDIDNIKKIARDNFLEKDIEYDLKNDAKALEKLNKKLEEQKKEIEDISRQIDKYQLVHETKQKYTNFGSLLSGALGIGVGLLTLPFSFCRTFALGTNMMQKSIKRINKEFKVETSETVRKDYKVSLKDIETFEKSLKSSDFLLKDTLDELDRLKYKIKYYEYKLPDAKVKIKEIEALEKGLSKKKEDLTKIVESFEKQKVKALNRNVK